ncbi:MAG: histidine triad nucleotide-binding protein [Anaerolineae bacterium]|nr:histidine triad nucleotide-binding protein [Anaerolineae bacterium]
MSKSCIFCRIVARTAPAEIVFETETVLAFRDIRPVAPIHILVIPRQHLTGPADLDASSAGVMAEMFLAVKQIAAQEGFEADGYRMVLNRGTNGGQEVPHLHLHILAGRRLRWPPG